MFFFKILGTKWSQRVTGKGLIMVLQQQVGGSLRPIGRILLLTNLRYCGIEFNPVSFYFVFDKQEQQLCYVVAEVNNIPWHEQHHYVLTATRPTRGRTIDFGSHLKEFHVSPFIEMENIKYWWRFSKPGESLTIRVRLSRQRKVEESDSAAANESVGVNDGIANSSDMEQQATNVLKLNVSSFGTPFFSASVDLQRLEWNTASTLFVLLCYPFMTLKVILAIHFEASKLWFRSFEFYPHPNGTQTAASKVIALMATLFEFCTTVLYMLLGRG